MPSLPRWLQLSGEFPMDLRIPPLNIKIMLESNPLNSIILVRRLAVWSLRYKKKKETTKRKPKTVLSDQNHLHFLMSQFVGSRIGCQASSRISRKRNSPQRSLGFAELLENLPDCWCKALETQPGKWCFPVTHNTSSCDFVLQFTVCLCYVALDLLSAPAWWLPSLMGTYIVLQGNIHLKPAWFKHFLELLAGKRLGTPSG